MAPYVVISEIVLFIEEKINDDSFLGGNPQVVTIVNRRGNESLIYQYPESEEACKVFPEPIQSNIAQTIQLSICSIEHRYKYMEAQKPFRLDAYDPRKSTNWEPLQEIGEDELVAAEQLRNILNRTNSPVLLRIVRKHALRDLRVY